MKQSLAKKGIIPKNLNDLHKLSRRKVRYYVNDILIKTFDSCTIAANYFKMTPNIFNLYVGRKPRKSKYFPESYKLEYYE